MPNERQTEAFVRRHFSTWAPEVAVEEQGSESPRIAKLLRAASKSGAGQGRPDFIVQFRDEPELLAVIECKARTTAHESQTRQAHADYAVDGALNYAAHLNKGFDVLAIAVSGTAKRHRVSHFLHLRSQREVHQAFGDALLTPEDYLRGYRNDDAKYRQDFGSLQVFIKELNETLHIDRVSEGDRALLISAILIALEAAVLQEGICRAEQNRGRSPG